MSITQWDPFILFYLLFNGAFRHLADFLKKKNSVRLLINISNLVLFVFDLVTNIVLGDKNRIGNYFTEVLS